MNKSNQPQYVRVNPFTNAAAPPPKPEPAREPERGSAAPAIAPSQQAPTKAELDALATAVRRRVTRLAIVFVGVCLLLVAGEIWITQELLNRQRSAVDQNAAIINEHTRRFRNTLNVQEMQLKQMLLDAHIHKKSLETIAGDARAAYGTVLSNNIVVAGVARTTVGTAHAAEGDALAVREARRNAQQIEIEFNLALTRIRKDYLTLSSNLVSAFETDLKGRSALLDQRVKEAEALLASVKQSATEAEKLRKTIEASLAALRSATPPAAPAPAPVPGPAPTVVPTAAPTTVAPPAAPPKAVAPAPAPVLPPPTASAPVTPAPKPVAPTPSPAPPQTKN